MLANCEVRNQRVVGGLKCGAARLLLSNRVIDPCLFVRMEAWPVALKGYQPSMDMLMGCGLWPEQPMEPRSRGEKTTRTIYQERGAASPYQDDYIPLPV